MNWNILKLSIVFFISQPNDCANILGIFPTASFSHQVTFRVLMKDLAARGHQLTIMTTDPINSKNPNVTEIDWHYSYEAFRKGLNFVASKNRKMDEADLRDSFVPIMLNILEEQLRHPQVQDLILNKDRYQFDVIIVEYLNYAPILAFGEIYNCPIIGVTSLDTLTENHMSNGNEANPVVHPEILFSYTHGKLTFSERWSSLKYYLKSTFSASKREKNFKEIIQKHFPNVTASTDELRKKVALLMTNTNPAMGFIRPLLPNTIQLGFMHIEPPKPLSDGELKSFLDQSKKGVIYMSLGSNVHSKDLGIMIQSHFINVFRSLDFDVVWKFEADEMSNKPENVLISKWLPQSDLLAHPKIKLMICQGGQQSMDEAIDRMIPMIVIPFLFDQEANAKRMVQRGIGFHLELDSLTEKNLKSAINEMLNPKYKENIRKLRDLVYDEPMTSRERAVWWTEYVIRHKGAKHLEYPGRNVPFYQRYCLDFIAIFVTGFIFIFKIIVIAWNTLRNQTKSKSD